MLDMGPQQEGKAMTSVLVVIEGDQKSCECLRHQQETVAGESMDSFH